MIVSPITALYKWPRVINLGAAVGISLSLDETNVSALFWHNPIKNAQGKSNKANNEITTPIFRDLFRILVSIVVCGAQKYRAKKKKKKHQQKYENDKMHIQQSIESH